jgi:hypothetical protein
MKYVSLFLVLVLGFSTFCYAQDEHDEPIVIPDREGASLQVLSSPHNFFDGHTIINILREAYYWFDRADHGDLHRKSEVKQQLSFWINALDHPGVSDPAEIAALGMGEKAYFEDRYNREEGEVFTEDEWNANPASGYAHHQDLTVTENVTLGYHFSRNQAGWSGKESMIKMIDDGTEYVFYAQATQTPIVLDLDGDGRLEASNGKWLPHDLQVKVQELVSFDINGDGFAEKTEWIGSNDALLVEYTGGEMTAKNLFGNEGGRYKNGFEKLSLFDKNGDSKLTGDELSGLSVWQDKNGNAKVDQGEVSSLGSLGITEIKISHIHCVSSFIQNGERKNIWDWHPRFFEVKRTK